MDSLRSKAVAILACGAAAAYVSHSFFFKRSKASPADEPYAEEIAQHQDREKRTMERYAKGLAKDQKGRYSPSASLSSDGSLSAVSSDDDSDPEAAPPTVRPTVALPALSNGSHTALEPSFEVPMYTPRTGCAVRTLEEQVRTPEAQLAVAQLANKSCEVDSLQRRIMELEAEKATLLGGAGAEQTEERECSTEEPVQGVADLSGEGASGLADSDESRSGSLSPETQHHAIPLESIGEAQIALDQKNAAQQHVLEVLQMKHSKLEVALQEAQQAAARAEALTARTPGSPVRSPTTSTPPFSTPSSASKPSPLRGLLKCEDGQQFLDRVRRGRARTPPREPQSPSLSGVAGDESSFFFCAAQRGFSKEEDSS